MLWKVRGDDAMRILWACVGAIENFLREPLHASQRKMGRTHKIVCNCQKEPTGCGSENSVEFGLHWGSEGMGDVHLEKLEGECVEKKCGEKWELRELMDVKCDSDENGMGKDNFGQDCFVSHIGTERHSVVYPSREESESRGLGVLRYDDDLRICF